MTEHPDDVELRSLSNLVNEFAKAMKAKLYDEAEKGRRGWWAKSNRPNYEKRLIRHALRGQMIDAANFAAFVWNIDRREAEDNEESLSYKRS